MTNDLSLAAVLVALVLVGTAVCVRFRKNSYQQELRQISHEIHREERQAIARELQDNIGQLLSAARISILHRTATPVPGQPDPGELVGQAIHEIRAITRGLISPEDRTLEEMLYRELVRAGRHLPPLQELAVEGSPFPLDPERSLVLFRVAQQLLFQACAAGVSPAIRLTYQEERISLTFGGFPQHTTGAEWEVILRRIRLLEGEIISRPMPDGTDTITVVCTR
ncbi:sensor histidine kinase [Siphonobacter aquaeclarae]|uniref:Histidine kinase n=1 Tax=Siphonobacter aquaeclarae TaxID=563176 RepID=A0A1G9IAK7_9BACT|nr:histidine kinase [Siphonobacter aquaeclarae]SDL22290.1 Histidine kinase [Siphonobacter aquaeclarae]